MNTQRIVIGVAFVLLLSATLVGAANKLGHVATPLNAVKTFEAKRCVRCHLIDVSWEAYGPDLARASLSGNFADIVGRMWNKAPVMYKKMDALGIGFPQVGSEDLIRVASFVGVYQNMLSDLTRDADIERGATLFHRHSCAKCHNSKHMRGSLPSPMLALADLWNHQKKIRSNGDQSNVSWKKLSKDDVKDLLGFLTDKEIQDGASATNVFLAPGVPQAGKRGFAKLKCVSCHRGAHLSTQKVSAGASANTGRLEIGNVIAALWNHSPQVWKTVGIGGQSAVTAQTLADIVAYWYAERFEQSGDETYDGKSLFERKSCASCHEVGSDDFVIPNNEDEFLAQMWSHVPDMIEACADNEIKWPQMQPGELSAIADYLIVADRQNSQ